MGYIKKIRHTLRIFLLLLPLLCLAPNASAQKDFTLKNYSYTDSNDELQYLKCRPGAIQKSGEDAFFECTSGDSIFIFHQNTDRSVYQYALDTQKQNKFLGSGWQEVASSNQGQDAVRYDTTETPLPSPTSQTALAAGSVIHVTSTPGLRPSKTPRPTKTMRPSPTPSPQPEIIIEESSQRKSPVWPWIVLGILLAGAILGFILKDRLPFRSIKIGKKRIRLGKEADTANPSEEDPDTISIFQNPSLHYSFGNLQQQGKRDYQEDAFCFTNTSDSKLIDSKGFLAVLADGMGGLKKGREASQTAVSMVRDGFEHLDVTGNIPDQLRKLAVEANRTIYQNEHQESGTTLIVIHFFQDHIYWLSIGDSIAWLFRKGRLYQLNREHDHLSDVQLKFLYQEITRAQMQNEPKLSALTSNIGRRDLKEVDQNRIAFPLKKGDRILICTDGVSGRLSEEEITLAMKQANAQSCCDMIGRLIQQKDNYHQDNYTAQIICCD